MGLKKGGASMYAYEAAQTQTVNTVDVYHAVIGLSEGTINNAATFLASATGAITSTADNSGVLRCTDATHGLTTGQIITLNGMGDAAHNGITKVTVIDPDTFDCDNIVYNSAADTGSWQRGSSLTINTGFGGPMMIGFSVSASSAVASKDYKFEVYKNITALDEFAWERLFNNTGYGVGASGAISNLQAGDIIWIGFQNTTDTTNLTLEHANLHIKK